MIRIFKRCIFCGKMHEIIVEDADYRRWQKGEYVQDVWPHWTAAQRETFISGSCSTCFDDAFKEPE